MGGPLLCQNESKRVFLVSRDENGNARLPRARGSGPRRNQGRGQDRGQRRPRYEKREEAAPVDAAEDTQVAEVAQESSE